jgi:hypothetical protein
MVETWLNAKQCSALEKVCIQEFRKRAARSQCPTRLSEKPAPNGKRETLYPLSFLSEAAKMRHAEQTAQQSGALAIREAAAPAERKRVIVPNDKELQLRVEKRLEAIAPLMEYDRLRKGAERRKFLHARGVKNLSELAEQAGAAIDKTGRTIFEWFGLYKKEQEPGLAGRIRADRGKSRFFAEHGAAAAFVKNAYLIEGLNLLNIRDILWRRWAEIGETGERPSYQTIRRYIRTIPKPIDTLAREGEEKFRSKWAPFILRNAPPAMHWWVADHRVHDVFAYNTLFSHEPRGKAYRPWMTAVYDWGSRKLMGCIWAPTPSSQTINSAVRMGIAQAGFPKNLYWDNGKDFQAVARVLTSLLEAQQVSITSALPFSPRSKPIESYFGRWAKRFDPMWRPAYSGNKPSNCPPECREAQKLHAQWLAGKRERTLFPSDIDFISTALQFAEEYNDTPLESLDGRTPNQVFDEQYPEAQRKLVDRRLLDRLFWKRDDRTVLAGGCVELDRLRYEPVLENFGALATACGQRVTLCRDPYDLGEAIALDAGTGEFLGELRIQERIDQAPQGRLTQDVLRTALRRERALKRASQQYLNAIETIASTAGWKPEREALLDRARGIKTGTNGCELLRGAAPGSGSTTAPPGSARLLPASPFISDAAREDAPIFADLFERTDDRELLRGAAPGANASATQPPAVAKAPLAPAFVSDGVKDDDDFGPVELEK